MLSASAGKRETTTRTQRVGTHRRDVEQGGGSQRTRAVGGGQPVTRCLHRQPKLLASGILRLRNCGAGDV